MFLLIFYWKTLVLAYFFQPNRHFFMSAFFTLTAFCCSFVKYFILSCCTASATDLRELFLLSGIFYLTFFPHICHSTTSAMDFRELFLPSGIFYLTLLPNMWHNNFYWAFSGSWQFFLEGCRTSQLGLKHRPGVFFVFLFESHSFQQKVLLVGRFYLCVTLRNTVATCLLIATWIIKCISYPLDHRSL